MKSKVMAELPGRGNKIDTTDGGSKKIFNTTRPGMRLAKEILIPLPLNIPFFNVSI
jgi:predicted transcriptional regulator